MAKEILVSVRGRKLTVDLQVEIHTGNQNSLECVFTFDDEWDGLAKTAVFKDANGKSWPTLIADDLCIVPHEATDSGTYFELGIFGVRDGNIVVTTGLCVAELKPGCYTAIAPPSEDIYLQILNEFSTSTARVEAAAQKVQASADEIQAGLPAIHADAETAKAKAAESTAAAGAAKQSQDDAERHKVAAQESAADALASAQAAGESEENVAAMQSDVQRLAGQVAADKADVAAKAQAVDEKARQVRETADGFPAVADSAKAAVTTEGARQVGLVAAKGTEQVKAVADKGAEQVAAVNQAGAAQTANAKAQADRAKTEADRAEQEANRAESIDAYTKVDARQAFANAFVGEKSGAMVSLPDIAENTLLRKAAVQGATTEVLANPEAEKSPDNIASISGVEPTRMTACGKNLFDMNNCFPGESRVAFGIIFTKVPDGILANGTAERQSYTIPYDMLPELKVGRTYTASTNDALAVPNFQISKPGGKENKKTYMVDGTETKIEVYFYFNAGVTVNNLLVQLKLEEGSAATAYEPYVGTSYPSLSLNPS